MSLIRVLVIDHNADWRADAEILLTSRGITHIEMATTVEEGVRTAATFKPNLVVLGIGSTDVRGLEGVRMIRSVSPRSRLLLVSAHENQDMTDAAQAIERCSLALRSRVDYELHLAVTLAVLDLLQP